MELANTSRGYWKHPCHWRWSHDQWLDCAGGTAAVIAWDREWERCNTFEKEHTILKKSMDSQSQLGQLINVARIVLDRPHSLSTLSHAFSSVLIHGSSTFICLDQSGVATISYYILLSNGLILNIEACIGSRFAGVQQHKSLFLLSR